MKFLAVVLSTLILAFVSAAPNIVKTDTKNDTVIGESKIIGGIRTDIEMTPSIVAILLLTQLICCGHLIAARVVVGTAHCVINKPISDLTIRSGSDYYNRGGLVVAVSRVTIHPHFLLAEFYNFDIAIMYLANSAIVPGIPANIILLSDTHSFFPPGTLGTVSGWGWTTANGRNGLSNFLRSIVVPIVPEDACASYGPGIPSSNICAGFTTRGKDPCRGDSGAGLVIDNLLAGINSFGLCGTANVPSVYTSIPKFRNWIREQVHI